MPLNSKTSLECTEKKYYLYLWPIYFYLFFYFINETFCCILYVFLFKYSKMYTKCISWGHFIAFLCVIDISH